MRFILVIITTGTIKMKIALLSGKGGTGKTFVSVNMAFVAEKAMYIDCDVEEPNGHLFLKPQIEAVEEVKVAMPKIDHEKCTGCRKCVEFCRFNALAYVNNAVKVFEDVCHSCGGCMLVCPENAIVEKDKTIGKIEKGRSGEVSVKTGILNMGEASGVPIVKQLIENVSIEEELSIIDAPPGSACIVMEAIKDVDYCVLVAEPTIFGTQNLSMVHELVKLFDIPYGVVLNKCLDDENPAEKYCEENEIHVIGKVIYSHDLALLSSQGEIVSRVDSSYYAKFKTMLERIFEEVHHGTTSRA